MSNYPGYEQQPPGYYAPPNSTMAIVSLVAGILGWTLVPGLGSIVAVITGHLAKKEIRESGGRMGGDGFATAGLILGYVAIGLGILGFCVALFFIVLVPLLLGAATWQSSSLPLLIMAL